MQMETLKVFCDSVFVVHSMYLFYGMYSDEVKIWG